MSTASLPTHPVARRRGQLQWSQAELARRAGVPRTTVSAIEGARLNPSVTAALALGRALECSVEELFGRDRPGQETAGVEWAVAPRTRPCRYWEAEVGGRTRLYPTEDLSMNVVPHDGVWRQGPGREADPDVSRNTLVVACCDPAAGLLAAEYARVTGFRVIVLPRGGDAALGLLRSGLVHAAGLHRSTREHPGRNADTVRTQLGDGFHLLRVADWNEGVALSLEDPSRSIQGVVRNVRRWARREKGSAARECLDELSSSAPGRTVFSHSAVAEAVRGGWAEAGVCVQFAAEEAGLRFVPIRTESLDFCLAGASLQDPRVQALVRLLRTRSYRRLLGELPGYDVRETGTLRAV
jgi:molybdate-binding protein/DNA-binding XRE family transcriptional regulator